MRELDRCIGTAFLGTLDFLEQTWGQWNYNKEYSQVQFSVPGALQKYNELMETIKAASSEQKDLQESARRRSSQSSQ